MWLVLWLTYEWCKCCSNCFIDVGRTLWYDMWEKRRAVCVCAEFRRVIAYAYEAMHIWSGSCTDTSSPTHAIFPHRWYNVYMSRDRVEEICRNTLDRFKLKKQTLGISISFGRVRLGGTWKFIWETNGNAPSYFLPDWFLLYPISFVSSV